LAIAAYTVAGLSGTGELPLCTLSEPDLNLSAHPALIIQSLFSATLLYLLVSPIIGWPNSKARWSNTFTPSSLQRLQRYYELVRPPAPHRYSHSHGSSTLSFSLRIGTTGSHVPHKSLDQVHATSMPDAVQAVNRFPMDLSWSSVSLQFRPHPSVFDTSSMVRLRSSTWTLPDTVFATPFPSTLTQGLFTHAAWGGLKPAPVSRLRGTYPHIFCSFVAHFQKSSPWDNFKKWGLLGEMCIIKRANLSGPTLCYINRHNILH